MSIQKGDPIPDAKLFDRDESGAARVILASERFAGKRIVLFAVPGAFTRTCSEKHLPSFVQHADAIKAQGIDEIVCVARCRGQGPHALGWAVRVHTRHGPGAGSEQPRFWHALQALCHAY